MATDTTAFERAVRKLSVPELKKLYEAIVRRDFEVTPTEKLAGWYHRQELKRFNLWARTLSTLELGDIYLRTIAGERIAPPDDFRPDLKPDLKLYPAPDGAGPPNEGNNDHNHQHPPA